MSCFNRQTTVTRQDGPPPIEILSIVMSTYILSSPVLQSLILVHVAVSIGANILKLRDAAEAEAAMGELEEQQQQQQQQHVSAGGIGERECRLMAAAIG